MEGGVNRAGRPFALLLILGLVAGACGPAEQPAAPTPEGKPTGPATATVRRGAIVETVRGVGRVSSASETGLFFRAAGRVRSVNVEGQQPVKKGEVIAELETGQLGIQLESARVNMQIAELRSSQATHQSGESSLRLAAADVAKAESDLAKASADYVRALADLDHLRATAGGTAQSPVKALEAGVTSARARLALIEAGAQPVDIVAADQGVVAARATVGKAEADLNKARQGFTPEEIRAGEHSVEAAKNAVYAAQVERDAARGRADGTGTAAGEARIAAAKANLDAANDRLATMRAGGKPADVAVAQQSLEAARATLTAAESRLAALRAGPRPEDLTVAKSAVDEAQARVDAARAELAGAPSLIEAGAAAVAAAKAAVDAATKSVDVARAAYDQRAEELKRGGGKTLDAAVAEKQLEIARLSVQALEQQIEDARISAPFDGTLGEIAVKAGDQVLAYRTVGTVADPSRLEVTLDIPAANAAKFSIGQETTIKIGEGPPLTEKIIGLPGVPASGTTVETRPVRVSLDPKAAGVALGAPVSGSVTAGRREDVLLVPAAAVKRFGNRTLVQVVGADGRRRDVEVQIGITTDAEVEVLQGLSEGQAVVAS
jgi:RND family efflux transporter MFP subunit